MTLEELLTGGGAVLVVLTLVQITPVKIDPWSALARAIGRAINGEVLEKVNALEKKVDAMGAASEKREAVNARTRILRFGDEVLHGVHHTKDHFDQTLRDIDMYEQYCREHPDFENNVTGQISRRIETVYRECLENGEFL